MPILDAAKDVNNPGTSGALDMRIIPSRRSGYFSATPRICELQNDDDQRVEYLTRRTVPAISMTNADNFAESMAVPASL
jgi:hypothetical protein